MMDFHAKLEQSPRDIVDLFHASSEFVLVDPMGGAPFALWYGTFLLVVDEYLQVLPAYGPRVRQMFWALATVALIPWGLPFVPTLWPGQMT